MSPNQRQVVTFFTIKDVTALQTKKMKFGYKARGLHFVTCYSYFFCLCYFKHKNALKPDISHFFLSLGIFLASFHHHMLVDDQSSDHIPFGQESKAVLSPATYKTHSQSSAEINCSFI